MPSESMRDVAYRLLAVEAAGQSASSPPAHTVVRVCEKLRIALTRFAGANGFTSLMQRALTLARAEIPSLQTVTLRADGSLEGVDELAMDETTNASEAAVVVIAHLLGLLETFIGKPLMLRLVGEAWPDVLMSMDE